MKNNEIPLACDTRAHEKYCDEIFNICDKSNNNEETLYGIVMRLCRGTANPNLVKEYLKNKFNTTENKDIKSIINSYQELERKALQFCVHRLTLEGHDQYEHYDERVFFYAETKCLMFIWKKFCNDGFESFEFHLDHFEEWLKNN